MPNGDPGAIYTIDPTTGAVTLFASIPNMTNFRALTGPGDTPYTNNSFYEADNGSDPTNPNLGWQSVGTTSLGGLDINTAGTQMYVMDLQHRTLDVLGIKPNGTWDGTLTQVAVPIPADASAAANMRPFAVHYHNGLVYIGEVDSAQSTQNAAQLRATSSRSTPPRTPSTRTRFWKRRSTMSAEPATADRITSCRGPTRTRTSTALRAATDRPSIRSRC